MQQEVDPTQVQNLFKAIGLLFAIGFAYFYLSHKVDDGEGPTRWYLLRVWLSTKLQSNSFAPAAQQLQPAMHGTLAAPHAPASVPFQEMSLHHNMPHWWLQVVNNATHIMIASETGAGKSTTAYALVVARSATDKIAIIDPHRKFNNWPVEPVNKGRDWNEIDRLFITLEREMDRRYDEGESVGAPLTVVIDEYPVISAECDNAPRIFKRLVREGRKVSMRLILLTQSSLVKTLGIEGEGDVRENLWKILLGGLAADVPGIDTVRPAALERQSKREAISLNGLLELAKTPVPSDVVWLPDLTTAVTGDVNAKWTEQHIRVAAWLAQEPAISVREIARRLHPGTDGGGKYSTLAKEIRKQVEDALPDTVNLF